MIQGIRKRIAIQVSALKELPNLRLLPAVWEESEQLNKPKCESDSPTNFGSHALIARVFKSLSWGSSSLIKDPKFPTLHSLCRVSREEDSGGSFTFSPVKNRNCGIKSLLPLSLSPFSPRIYLGGLSEMSQKGFSSSLTFPASTITCCLYHPLHIASSLFHTPSPLLITLRDWRRCLVWWRSLWPGVRRIVFISPPTCCWKSERNRLGFDGKKVGGR